VVVLTQFDGARQTVLVFISQCTIVCKVSSCDGLCISTYNGEGYAVAQLVEALCYKPECRGFDSRWCHWNFSLT
jgi:hypothetical protein